MIKLSCVAVALGLCAGLSIALALTSAGVVDASISRNGFQVTDGQWVARVTVDGSDVSTFRLDGTDKATSWTLTQGDGYILLERIDP
jgi:hypothetical protein